jgi:hypothetical protein
MRNLDEIDGQPEGVGLPMDELPANTVHGDAVIGLAKARNQPDDT